MHLLMQRFHLRMGRRRLGDLGRVARNVSLDPDHLLGAVTHAN